MAYDPEYHRNYYQKNKEAILQRQKETKEERSETLAAWKDRNREKMNAYLREYRKGEAFQSLPSSSLTAQLIKRAKARAKIKGVPCTITSEDITIPEVCPVFKVPMYKGEGRAHDFSPSIDEVVPGLGYVPGNIQIISLKANMMKQNSTPEQLREFAQWILGETDG